MLLIFLQTLYITLNITIKNLNAQIIEKSEELGCFNPLSVFENMKLHHRLNVRWVY